MKFRRAELADIPLLSEIRKIQLQDEGMPPVSDMDQELYRYFKEKMEQGDLVQWIAEEEGELVATGAIIFMDFPPNFFDVSGRKGYIANMYTADAYRGRGLAGQILERLEAEAKERGVVNLLLFASEAGRRAYVKSGFKETSIFMDKDLPAE